MKDLLILLVHLLTTIAKLLGPGGAKAIVADSLLMKQQLLVINRSRQRVPNLSTLDRFLLAFWSLFLNPRHLSRAAIIIRPSTLLKFHNLRKQRKYRRLYSSAGSKRKPGPKNPSQELIQAIVEMKQRNPRFGCPRIAQQINKAFGSNIDKDVVRRVLAAHYRPEPSDGGPSWLTFIGHSVSITMLIVCTLHSMATHHQLLATKPSSVVPPSTNSSGSRIAASYTSYPLPPE